MTEHLPKTFQKRLLDMVKPCLKMPNDKNTWKMIADKAKELLHDYPQILDSEVYCNEHTNMLTGIEKGIITFAIMFSYDRKKYIVEPYELQMEKQKIKDLCRDVEGGIFKNGGKVHVRGKRKQD